MASATFKISSVNPDACIRDPDTINRPIAINTKLSIPAKKVCGRIVGEESWNTNNGNKVAVPIAA
jgi:hypothetical protein